MVLRRVSRLRAQVFANYISMAANISLPLAMIPIITNEFGMAAYGAFSVLVAIASLGMLFVDFGFEVGMVGRLNSLAFDEISCLISAVHLVKTLMALLCLVFINAIGTYILPVLPGIEDSVVVILCVSVFPLYSVLLSNWLYLSLERPLVSSLCNVVAKALTLFLAFMLASWNASLDFYIYIYVVVHIFIGTIAFFSSFRVVGYNLKSPGFGKITSIGLENVSFFGARLSAMANYHLIPIVGLKVLGAAEVGMLDVLLKFYRGYLTLYGIFAQSIYPYVMRSKKIILVCKALGAALLTHVFFVAIYVVFFDNITPPPPVAEGVLFFVTTAAIISTFIGYPVLGMYSPSAVNRGALYSFFVSVFFLFFWVVLGLSEPIFFAIVLYEAFNISYRLMHLFLRRNRVCGRA